MKRNMVALILVTYMVLIRKFMVSMATESFKMIDFIDFGYFDNEKECFSFYPKNLE